jgi:hypothetical protein
LTDLVIFHYHFLPGGVTDVVTSALISYLNHSKGISCIKVVSGRLQNLDIIKNKIMSAVPETKMLSLTFEVFPYIDYVEKIDTDINAEILQRELESRYSLDKNVWWIHNYHLGKNPIFTKALLNILHTSQQRMVFQIHDFPECSRYALLNRLKEYIKDDFYPQNNNVKYVVINNRDRQNLINAGMNKNSVFLLENPIQLVNWTCESQSKTLVTLSKKWTESFPSWKKNEKYMLYPVRAIRRKNIAEAALLATLSEKNLIITLPGISETEKKYSEKCKKIFSEGLTPGMFGIGINIESNGLSFKDLITASSLILSSSIQEGFGYLYLNSMNWGKPLLAKDLDILSSFKKSFTGFPSYFYEKLSVPINLENRKDLLEQYLKKFNNLKSQMNHKIISDLKEKIISIFNEEYVDFSYLSLDEQINVLHRIKNENDYREKCKKINIFLINKLNSLIVRETIPSHKTLQENWSLKSYSIKSEKIVNSFTNEPIYLVENLKDLFIYETMLLNFADPQYLRLLYDE